MIDKVDITAAQRKARRSRSIAIGLALGVLVVLIYLVSLVKMVHA